VSGEQQKKPIWPVIIAIVAACAIVSLMTWDMIFPYEDVPDDYTYTDPPAGREMDNLLRKTVEIDTPGPKDIATGPGDTIYIGGNGKISIVDNTGKAVRSIEVKGQVVALDVQADGTIFAAADKRVLKIDPDGRTVAGWDLPGTKPVPTDLAVSDDSVFVADATEGVVLHFDRSGKLLNRIGRKGKPDGFEGFAVPSPFFSLFIGNDGYLRIANPGQHRIEVFTKEGRWMKDLCWGQFSSTSPQGFTGCCNPTHITLLGSDRCITSEKGTPRVKIYGDCELVGIIAGPKRFATAEQGLATAVLAGDRICILEPSGRKVHFIEVKK
jgi:hypothetical protein